MTAVASSIAVLRKAVKSPSGVSRPRFQHLEAIAFVFSTANGRDIEPPFPPMAEKCAGKPTDADIILRAA